MSAITPQPFAPSKSDPNLADLLDLLKKDILLNFSSHHIGMIQSFNAVTQTATATINYKKTRFKFQTATGLFAPTLVDYPVLIDCPVISLGGGSSALTFPIVQGDECLIFFNDRDIDNWFQGAGGGACATLRLHSFSDAIILVGVRSLAHVLPAYDTVRAVLRNGAGGLTMVGVGPTLIKIANATTTLNTLLQSLITDIQNLVTQVAAITVTGVTTGGGVSGVPFNAAAITAIAAQLTTTSGQIAGLLE
jgi:hypothetical protein